MYSVVSGADLTADSYTLWNGETELGTSSSTGMMGGFGIGGRGMMDG